MPDRDTWGFINTFAPWFSAFGTLCAVVTSLYLARRNRRAVVRVRAAVINIISPGQGLADSPEFLQISAINHGPQNVKIQGIMWKLVGERRRMFFVVPPTDAHSTTLPARLEPGDEACFLFPTATFQKDGKALFSCIQGSKWRWLAIRRMRAGVYSTTGERFITAPHSSVRELLAAKASAVSLTSHAPDGAGESRSAAGDV